MQVQGMTVLHVEDNVIDRFIVREAFAEHAPHVRVVMATTAAEAVPLARTEHPDLILLDLHLPDGTGDQLLEVLRRDPRCAHVPVIITSADDREATRWAMARAGAYGYLTKPLDTRNLVALVTGIRAEAIA